MNYEDSLSYIKEKEKKGSVFGLDTVRELLRRLDNPEKGIPAVHIAGTNGKGSIMSFVEEALVKAGVNVGRYISPTIYDYRERWSHNKIWASEEDIAEVLTEVRRAAEGMERDCAGSPTAFEIETAAAFVLFQKWNCDIILIECGMGGRMDATNVIEENVINVLASVSRDHMQVLGESIEEITKEKLGIVRKRSILVSYPQIPEVESVIKEYTKNNKVRLINVDESNIKILSEGIDGSTFEYRSASIGEAVEIHIGLGGRYQVYNAVTALEVLGEIMRSFPCIKNLKKRVILKAFDSTRWDGRFQIIRREPEVIVDGAHNEDAWMRLAESLKAYYPDRKLVFVIGVLADKEYHRMIDILKPLVKKAYTIQSDNPRALPAKELAEELQKKCIEAVALDKISDILDVVTNDGNVYIICGSLSISGEVIELLSE
ncbi:MAG: bifunctional folylpolyglutamate synthase/dihydrofolate synthase [Eubacterium sp.]|nr:bifunctional folylpolyglutamate synthase/dihydrofolate synthase [Eubacterium sp.]